MVSLAPSPFTFYKATTKYDSKPRGAPTGDEVWGDLERPVCGVSDEPTREDTVKLRDLRKGMFDTKKPKKNLAMLAKGAGPKDTSFENDYTSSELDTEDGEDLLIDFDRELQIQERDPDRGGMSIEKAAFSSPSSRPKDRNSRQAPEAEPSIRMEKFRAIQAKFKRR